MPSTPIWYDPSFDPATLKKLKANNPYPPNMVDDLTVMKGTHDEAGPSTAAFVSKMMPSTVFMNTRYKDDPFEFKQLLPHEIEHVLQNQVSERGRYDPAGKTGYDRYVVEALAKRKGISNDSATKMLLDYLQNAGKSEVLNKHLASKGYTPSLYLGKMPGQYSLKEQFADLSGIESANKIDLTKDPVVRKEFFGNDQDFIDTYKGTTGFRTNRYDARDLPPMDAGPKMPPPPEPQKPGMLQSLMDMFK